QERCPHAHSRNNSSSYALPDVVSEEIGAAENPINNPVGVVLPTGSTSEVPPHHAIYAGTRHDESRPVDEKPNLGRMILNLLLVQWRVARRVAVQKLIAKSELMT
ncbi:MAG TPA: hypothetical protein VKT99_09095, partial [Xanthobacteraceae bacterium]|nr:hypothetical protein [Xanthobacteraceae bacterium]